MEKGKFYHIYNRTNNKELLFREHENYLFFLRQYKQFLTDFTETHAYCLMPNHFHFLIRVKEFEDEIDLLTLAFKNFFISYAKSFNSAYARSGSLFQQKFKKKLVDDESYLTSLICYIHANPVKAKLCRRLEDWPYSSYAPLLSQKATYLKREAVLNWFNGRDDFVSFHKQNLDSLSLQKYLFD